GLGTALQTVGKQQQAIEAFQKALASEPRRTVAYLNLAMTTRLGRDDPWFARMRDLARDLQSLDSEDQICLHFALGKALADHGDHQQSFHHLLEGNRLKR